MTRDSRYPLHRVPSSTDHGGLWFCTLDTSLFPLRDLFEFRHVCCLACYLVIEISNCTSFTKSKDESTYNQRPPAVEESIRREGLTRTQEVLVDEHGVYSSICHRGTLRHPRRTRNLATDDADGYLSQRAKLFEDLLQFRLCAVRVKLHCMSTPHDVKTHKFDIRFLRRCGRLGDGRASSSAPSASSLSRCSSSYLHSEHLL